MEGNLHDYTLSLEQQDYIIVKSGDLPKFREHQAHFNAIEYLLTYDMAKHIAMLDGGEKGMQIVKKDFKLQ